MAEIGFIIFLIAVAEFVFGFKAGLSWEQKKEKSDEHTN